jgi:stringent starvation protein B
MITKIIEDKNYQSIMSAQIYDVIEYLIERGQEFAITANIKGARFNPELPDQIANNFPPFTLFALANYTYETLELNDDSITFEAGFGAENYGSVVTIPLHAIFQIVVDESILFINPTATVEKFFKNKPKTTKGEKIDQVTRSMNAFKLNSSNKKLLD